MKDLSFHDIEERTGSDRENVKFNYFEATAENGNAVMCSSNGYYLGKKSKESYDLYAPNHARVNAQPLDLFEGEKRLMEEATRDHEEVMALPKVEPPKHQYVLMKTTKPNELATVRRVLGRKK